MIGCLPQAGSITLCAMPCSCVNNLSDSPASLEMLLYPDIKCADGRCPDQKGVHNKCLHCGVGHDSQG